MLAKYLEECPVRLLLFCNIIIIVVVFVYVGVSGDGVSFSLIFEKMWEEECVFNLGFTGCSLLSQAGYEMMELFPLSPQMTPFSSLF